MRNRPNAQPPEESKFGYVVFGAQLKLKTAKKTDVAQVALVAVAASLALVVQASIFLRAVEDEPRCHRWNGFRARCRPASTHSHLVVAVDTKQPVARHAQRRCGDLHKLSLVVVCHALDDIVAVSAAVVGTRWTDALGPVLICHLPRVTPFALRAWCTD